MTTRTLQVDVTDLAETMDFSVPDGLESYLDLRTGAVIHPEVEPTERDHLLAIPPFDEAYRYARMLRFAATTDRELASVLELALQGKGASRRFKNLVVRHGAADTWYGFQLELNRAQAMDWLTRHDITVIDVSKRLPPGPDAAPSQTVGLLDLMLLGAPDGKTELIEGKVLRRVPARSPEQSRVVFARLVREACAAAGLNGPDPTNQPDAIDAGRFHLHRYDDGVDVEVDVSRDQWDRFPD